MTATGPAPRQSCIHVLATLSQGGNETLARALIQNWPDDRPHCVAVLGAQDGPMRAEFVALAELDHLPLGWPLAVASLWQTWHWLRRRQPAAVVSYTFNIQALPLCWLARLGGVPRVVMRVGNPPPFLSRERRRWRWLIRFCRWSGIPLISCSWAVHQRLAALASLPRHSAPILNGCNLSDISARADASRSSRPAGDPQRIVMVARLDPIKDQAMLLRCYAALQPTGWQLQLVGEGPERGRLESLALRLGLDPRQLFLGRRADIPELLGQADLFAFATTADEGFGIALIEAMAAGLPVIASDVPACREVLSDGAAGDLLPADLGAWVDRLRLLTADAAARQALGARALAHAGRFDSRHTAKQWQRLLTP